MGVEEVRRDTESGDVRKGLSTDREREKQPGRVVVDGKRKGMEDGKGERVEGKARARVN